MKHWMDAAFAELERAFRAALDFGHQPGAVDPLARSQPEDQQFGHAIDVMPARFQTCAMDTSRSRSGKPLAARYY